MKTVINIIIRKLLYRMPTALLILILIVLFTLWIKYINIF